MLHANGAAVLVKSTVAATHTRVYESLTAAPTAATVVAAAAADVAALPLRAQPGVLLARDRTPARKRAYDAQYVPCHTDLYKGERGQVSNT